MKINSERIARIIFHCVGLSSVTAVILIFFSTLINILIYGSTRLHEPNLLILTAELGVVTFAGAYTIYQLYLFLRRLKKGT